MGGGKGLANSPYLTQDIVFFHGESSEKGSSWGVQIKGGSNPMIRQVDSILNRSVALAIWVQFQVIKYCIPWTAAVAM